MEPKLTIEDIKKQARELEKHVRYYRVREDWTLNTRLHEPTQPINAGSIVVAAPQAGVEKGVLNLVLLDTDEHGNHIEDKKAFSKGLGFLANDDELNEMLAKGVLEPWLADEHKNR